MVELNNTSVESHQAAYLCGAASISVDVGLVNKFLVYVAKFLVAFFHCHQKI